MTLAPPVGSPAADSREVGRPAASTLEVPPERLRRRADLDRMAFETTAEVEPLEGTIGQPRALDALDFGLEISTAGYNLFVTGAPGSGRITTLRDHLERRARTLPVPGDWVYVHNFQHPDSPIAISLPAGTGRRLARDMDEFVVLAFREIARSFEGDQYQVREKDVRTDIDRRQEELRARLESFARERGFAVQSTPAGIAVFPLVEGHPIKPADMENLTPEIRAELEHRSEEIHEELETEMRQLRQLAREAAERVLELERSVASSAVAPLIRALRDHYAESEEVLGFLAAVEEDIPEHLADFLTRGQHTSQPGLDAETSSRHADQLDRYRVNVFVDNGSLTAAPVVIEQNPTYYNLVGRVEYRAQFGSMVTDVSQVRPGALHRANGGFLVLEALDVLSHPFAWDALKRALRSQQATVENLAEQLSFIPTATLHPKPIPLDLKVILVGTHLLYLLLFGEDADLRELFKVKVDFAPDMEWNDRSVASYAAFISRWVRHNGLRHFDRSGVGQVVEYGAWLREDQRKLSTRLLEISDIVTEASFWAEKAGRPTVTGDDVDEAVRRREYRSNLVEERIREMIADGTIVIDTDGARTGQVNGLSVVELGDHSFGQPSRISATVSVGRGTVESVEREIKLSGPIHSKGVLVLSGYLAEMYAQEAPLAVRATISFEQSYDEVEGDSASSTELYALLSALAGVPLDQGIAVTGAVNQHGEVQAVGGVTRKVEGFYAVCRTRGLTGRQGVIIPAANVPALMLSDEVVDAVARGAFHVWAVHTVDEGVELLTGLPAGGRREDGSFPEGTVHGLVAGRLRTFAERLARASGSPDGAGEGGS